MGPGTASKGALVGRASELALLTGRISAALRDLPETFPPNEFHHAHLTVIAPGPPASPPRLDGPANSAEQRFAVFESVREYLTDAAAETGGRDELTALLAALARVVDSEPGGLPDAVRDTVLVRLQGLSVSCRDVLGVAAVLGRRWTRPRWRRWPGGSRPWCWPPWTRRARPGSSRPGLYP